jgi:hypothetical protein
MDGFEGIQNIDSFCKVLVLKPTESHPENKRGSADELAQPEIEEPLIDVFDEEDYLRILVQCRCREQQVTFHPSPDGITVCREECRKKEDGAEVCNNVCKKLNLKTDELQLDDMLFVIAKCNNNNTLEAMIPKLKR